MEDQCNGYRHCFPSWRDDYIGLTKSEYIFLYFIVHPWYHFIFVYVLCVCCCIYTNQRCHYKLLNLHSWHYRNEKYELQFFMSYIFVEKNDLFFLNDKQYDLIKFCYSNLCKNSKLDDMIEFTCKWTFLLQKLVCFINHSREIFHSIMW